MIFKGYDHAGIVEMAEERDVFSYRKTVSKIFSKFSGNDLGKEGVSPVRCILPDPSCAMQKRVSDKCLSSFVFSHGITAWHDPELLTTKGVCTRLRSG